MSPNPASDGLPPGVAGDFHGRPTLRIETPRCWFEVLAEAGPRIVRFGLPGEESILAEIPEVSWDQGYGKFELFGGHRVWFAPESPECSIPEASGVTLEPLGSPGEPPGGIALVGPRQAPIGLRKRIEIRPLDSAAGLEIKNVLTLEAGPSRELSIWPVTQLKLGGVARVELPPAVDVFSVRPNRLVALWEYASWSDDRLSLEDGLLSVRAVPAPRFKVGCLSHAGRIAYERDGLLFVKTFDARPALPRPDLGCNVEIYCDDASIELESLGPLMKLGLGESAVHVERWELRRAE